MRKFISISLAIILLAGNSGFSLATHYCSGLAVESKVVLGHKALDCGMANMDKECENDSPIGTHIKKGPCCENTYQSLDIEDDFKPSIVQSSVNVEFVAAFIITFLHLPISSINEEVQYANYSPPLIDQDISVLHQVFRI
ncbi:HYC_CC_PP family protein [Reichenbachiella faecimaris]